MVAHGYDMDANPDPREMYDRALELFQRGMPEESVAVLREAFFGNLLIGPALLGMRTEDDGQWPEVPGGSAAAAREYAGARRAAWQAVPHALRYLRCLWQDPLVRREIRSYGNFCKSFARVQGSDRLAAEFAAERAKFTNRRRIRSTQKEILGRIRRLRFDLPPSLPQASAVTVRTRAPEELTAFIKKVLGIAPVERRASDAWAFELQGMELRVARDDAADPAAVELTLAVSDFDYYILRMEDEGITPVEARTEQRRERMLLLDGPGGVRLRLVSRHDAGETDT